MFNKNLAQILALIVTLAVIIGAIAYSFYIPEPNVPPPQPAPTPETAPQKPVEPEPKPEGKWYVLFSVKQQQTTAYNEAAQAQPSSSGSHYFPGGVAVHPRYPINAGGNALQPIIPYGTELILEKPLIIQGQKFYSLTVIDTGDVNYRLWSQYPYWLDIYYGTTNYYNVKDAHEYGIDLINYYWIEEWK